ncbi:hypothetical protein [Acinetobacter haemolyticus]|uniref:hypothetical protein n=1 Tax=Acinetobacter haemolyticus TaxID=29430 RepID=UPI00148FB80C|nr:hypothetical protein [Acinetobacter haemolyticus]
MKKRDILLAKINRVSLKEARSLHKPHCPKNGARYLTFSLEYCAGCIKGRALG